MTDQAKQVSKRRRNIIIFALAVAAWIVFDIITKQYFNSNYEPRELINGPILGLFQFHLWHNTGAAWGLFNQSTSILAMVSLVVCLFIIVYFALMSKQASIGEVLGLALVLAGGVGNGIDRFFVGYVVDFIEFTFIDFPIFNIADIGVTCGFILFIASMIYAWAQEDRRLKASEKPEAETSKEEGFEKFEKEASSSISTAYSAKEIEKVSQHQDEGLGDSR